MKKLGLMFSVVFGLVGCSAGVTQLSPGAEQVQVANYPPAGTCEKLKKITVKQEGELLTGPVLEKGATNQLRNSAMTIGANYVQIIDNYSSSFRGGYDLNNVSSVTIVGVAYRC